MMSDVDVLYRDVILDHYKRPRNFRELDTNEKAEGHNPLCGDHLMVFVRIEDGVIQDLAFQGSGCAIATASASLMTEALRQRTIGEAASLAARFEAMLAAPPETPLEDLGDLSALSGVRRFLVRRKCATLPWKALQAAAGAHRTAVSTE